MAPHPTWPYFHERANSQRAPLRRDDRNLHQNLTEMAMPRQLESTMAHPLNHFIRSPYLQQGNYFDRSMSQLTPLDLYNMECNKRLEAEQLTPLDLYNMECNKRLEAEQLAIHRRHLEYQLQSINNAIELNEQKQPQVEPVAGELSGHISCTPEFSIVKEESVDSPPGAMNIYDSQRSIDGSESPESYKENGDADSEGYSMYNRPSVEAYTNYSQPTPSLPSLSLPRLIPINDEQEQEYTIDISTLDDRPKKKKIRCTICGEDAICKSYGAVCCDSCRLFFRRSIVKVAYSNYKCSAKRNCVVVGRHRSKCQHCRFQRCLKTGMKASSVLKNSTQKSVTSEELMFRTESPSSITSEPTTLVVTKFNDGMDNTEALEVHGVMLSYEKMRKSRGPPPMSSIDKVVYAFKDILSSYLTDHLFMASNVVNKEFVKSIQNESLSGALLLRMAFHYDPVIHGLPHCSVFSLYKKRPQQSIPEDLHSDILNTLKSIHSLKIDNTIICLLVLIFISHTDSSFDFYMHGTDEIVDKFTMLLRKYITSIHGPAKASDMFPKLLMKLVNIKEIQTRLDRYIMP